LKEDAEPRNMTHRLDSSQRFAAGEFRHLLGYLDERNYLIVDCLDQSRSCAARTVSFRYDIHLRDIHCAHGFLQVHRERACAGTFFLLHDYSTRERASERDFIDLAEQVRTAKDAGAGVELGLHDSPVDRYLLWRFADGDERRFVTWVSTGGAVDFFRQLANSDAESRAFNAAVLDNFVKTVRVAREVLGNFQLSAGHGGKLGQLLRPRLTELGELGAFVREYFAENWMTPAVLSAAGLSGDVERFKREVPAVAGVTEGGGRLTVMCERLACYTNAARPLLALIHPATWGGQPRDGEWSRLLPLSQQTQERVIVAASPKALARDLAGPNTERAFELAVFTEVASADSEVPEALQDRVASAVPFLDVLGGTITLPRYREVVWGSSARRYSPLVEAMLASLLGDGATIGVDRELQARAEGLARWLAAEADPAGKHRLSASELNYFLFSSSGRAVGLSRALRHFLGAPSETGIARMVDHGAGIAFVPLVVDGTVPLAQVICSEVKPQFVEAGLSLWASLGLGAKLAYQSLSVVDFVYPEAVDVIFCGHMLYRLPPDERARVISQAVQALRVGGLLVINELMNRPDLDNTYAHPCLKSAELLDYLENAVDVHAVDVARPELSVVPASTCPADFFKRSDNFVVAVKK